MLWTSKTTLIEQNLPCRESG